MIIPLISNAVVGDGDSSIPPHTASVVGIVVAITGNIVISFALNCQKLAHKRLEEERSATQTAESSNGNAVEYDDRTEPPSPSPVPTPLRPEAQPLLVRNGNGTTRSYSQPLTSTSPGAVRTAEVLTTRSAFAVNPPRSPTSTRLGLHRSTLDAAPNGSSNTILEEAYAAEPDADLEATPLARNHERARDREGRDRAISWVDYDPPNAGKKGANGNAKDANESGKSQNARFQSAEHETGYLKSNLWWLGFLLLNIGELGNFLSYAFAPASVVAPLGTFALIANCFFAPLMLKERFRKRDLIGIVIAIVGVVTVVLSGKASDVKLDPHGLWNAIKRLDFVIYATLSTALATTLAFLSEKAISTEYVFIDVGLVALFGGFTVLATKAVSTLISLEGFQVLAQPIFYPLVLVLGGTGVGQIKYLNRALMSFDSKVVIPTQFVLFNLAAIVGSAILYRDFDNMSLDRFAVFLYGCATTFVGVFVLTRPDIQLTPASEDEEQSSRPSTPSLSANNLPPATAYTPLLTPRSLRLPAGTPVLRHRASRASIPAFSPAYLLISTSPTNPNGVGPADIPIVRTRTRSESRGQSRDLLAVGLDPESLQPSSVRL